MEHVSQKMFCNVASADFYTNVNYYYRFKKDYSIQTLTTLLLK